MGCNTSKETIQQAVEDAKDDVKETAKDIARDLIKEESNNREEAKNGDVPKSAETVTVGGDEEEEQQQKEEEKEPEDNETTEEPKEEEVNEDEERRKEEEAATRIQAVFRGHHARKSMKETDTSATKQEDNEPTKEELEAEFREDDKELCHAATKIQATFRGHMSRKVDQAASTAKDLMDSAAEKIDEKMTDAQNELEGIDLSDPDLHKAATKIQASFRGHKVRQEVVIPEPNEKK